MSLFVSITLWLLIGGTTSYVALRRGRDPYAWFAIGILLGLLALLLLMVLPDLAKGEKGESDNKNDKDEMNNEIMDVMVTPALEPSQQDVLAKDWFYIDRDYKQQPAVAYNVLKELWDAGKIDTKTFVWSEGMPEWKRIGDLPNLLESLR